MKPKILFLQLDLYVHGRTSYIKIIQVRDIQQVGENSLNKFTTSLKSPEFKAKAEPEERLKIQHRSIQNFLQKSLFSQES